jgi:hypothetical protein
MQKQKGDEARCMYKHQSTMCMELRGQVNGEAARGGRMEGVRNKDQKECMREAQMRKALKGRHARNVTCSKEAVDWEGTRKQGTRFHQEKGGHPVKSGRIVLGVK